MLDLAKLWSEALTEIELDISKASFGTWFRHTRIVRQELGTVYLGVPNTFVKDWLATKYHKLILHCLRNLYTDVRAVEYAIIKNEETASTKPQEKPAAANNAGAQPGLEELYINKEDNLNPKYVFDSFVVGSFNELAFAASQAVVKKPGLVYNPLFIYGGTGLGKTHLIQSVGNYLKRTCPQKKVFYVTSEQFVVDYVNAIQNNKVNLFKEKYRQYDLLVMDDVQFLSDKNKTQEELFHLFNNLYENNKQIIFSSDKSPKHIPNIEDRLRSRFAGGMIVDISKPDYESRLAILRSKAKDQPVALSAEILECLALSIQDSIRELEGVLNSVVCQAQLKNRPPSITEVRILIKNSIKPKKAISIENVAEVVANFYNINSKMLYEKTRKKEVVKPRQIIMYLLREDFSTSFPYIGQKLGGRDHTTVIHAYDKIKRDAKENSVLSQEIEQIRSVLYSLAE